MAAYPSPPSNRAEVIADTAIDVLAERGSRGLTHRAVDERAGLPPGSTSNHARTRAALLESAVRRLAVVESEVLTPGESLGPDSELPELATAIARGLRRQLTEHHGLLVARYELALAASRSPTLRECYHQAGVATYQRPLAELLAALGSTNPERHARSLISWCEGVLLANSVGSYVEDLPTVTELRDSAAELLNGMLTSTAASDGRTG